MMLRLRASALAMLALTATSAAHAAGKCEIASNTGGTASATYDPFATSPTTANINGVQMIRLRGTGGALVTQITYYLRARATGLDGATLKVVSNSGASGGTGTGYNNNILVSSTGTPPTLVNSPAAVPSGAFRWTFNAADLVSSAPFTLNYQLVLPAGLDTAASTQLVFDLYYSCRARELIGTTSDDTGMVSAALALNLTVRNALQAYFNGQASANTLSFDYGEVGTLDTPTVTGAPGSYTKSGFINVRSSGAYSVSLTSDNNYRLTYPGGNPATPAQSLTYSATLLGQTRSGTSGSGTAVPAITKECQRGGVPAPGAQLPLSVTLTEGGRTKTPAPVYSDRLVITIAPIVSTAVGTCP